MKLSKKIDELIMRIHNSAQTDEVITIVKSLVDSHSIDAIIEDLETRNNTVIIDELSIIFCKFKSMTCI